MDAAITAVSSDTFECTLRSDVQLPNDFHQWPDDFRKASDAAVAKLLLDHSGAMVISDTSQCIDDTHPRFPAGEENKGKFWAVRTVKLDRHVEVEASDDSQSSAAVRLRAFEDEHFGKDAVRIRGHIEKGYGSPFKAMPEQKHAEYAALEKLVAAEQKVVEANAALSAAEVAHDAAVAELDAASQAAAPKGESSAGLE